MHSHQLSYPSSTSPSQMLTPFIFNEEQKGVGIGFRVCLHGRHAKIQSGLNCVRTVSSLRIGVLNTRFFFPPSKALSIVNGFAMETWAAHPAEFGRAESSDSFIPLLMKFRWLSSVHGHISLSPHVLIQFPFSSIHEFQVPTPSNVTPPGSCKQSAECPTQTNRR
jgi:hypothetical protein